MPVNPNNENTYAVHNAEVEEIFKEFFNDKKDFDFTIFRPCMILGARIDNFSCEFAGKSPFIPTIAGHNPEIQFVHEKDVLEAFIYGIKNRLDGIYNLTGKGTITMKDFCRIFKKPFLPLNFHILRTIHKILWTLRMPSVSFGPEWLSFFRYSCIATSDKFTGINPGFPKYSTREALETYMETRSCK